MLQRMPQLFDVDGEHDSVILAFWPDANAASLIRDRDGVWEKAEDLHITLAYCGKAPDMTDAQIARIIDAADVLSKEFGQLVVTLSGIGRFDKDDKSIIWAGVNSDQIHAMNARAKELLAERGIEVDAKYSEGYTPHMTLAYLEPGSQSPIDDFPDTPVLFRNLTISVAGRHAQLPLKEGRMNILDRLRAIIRSADPTARPVKRDLMMHMVWENVYRHFEKMNSTGISYDEDGYPEYDPDQMHWFQELYVASGGGMFALSVQGGKLFRSPVAVSDAGVSVGTPQPVVARFEPVNLQRTRVITRADNNLPIFLSILATAALNKANELDTRALFDTFVERFGQGKEEEYINVYHLGKSKSRIGRLLWVGRDENLLLGIWTPDDNLVGRAIAQTIEADSNGEWGVSIEFLPDNDGTLVEIVPGIEIRAFEAGTLWGASVVRSAHACSWFTGHMTETKARTFTMEKTVADAIKTLIQNPEALTEFETWVDGANRTIKDTNAITRTDGSEDAPVTLESLAATVAALSAKLGATGILEQTELPALELDESAVEGITQTVLKRTEFTALSDGIARLSGALEAQTKALTQSVEALTVRVAQLETGDEEKLRAHDELKPKGSRIVATWRAPRGNDEQKPTTERTISFANAASRTEQNWK